MSPHWSTDPGVWIAAALTMFIFSFLYKDNPFYKFAEHLFVGVSAGYWIILNFWTVIVPNLWTPLVNGFAGRGTVAANVGPLNVSQGDYRVLWVIPMILGVMLFVRLLPKGGWISRWPLAVILGVYAGIKTTGFAQGDFVAQVQASLQPLWTGQFGSSLNAVIFTVGLVTSLFFFYFSLEHKGGLGIASKIGMAFLMVGFGAGYGYTVMSRVSLLIGRFQFLLGDWIGLR
ncbi:MAG: hypothetical protein HOP12_16405 [Candidatus Eisenbacteria bacterium]|uniref:Uncharacterized protein n=1 Tax=Eiseniibacteriota bacterium TaxID=2212470 RepID=A0A849SSS0_UNCEI|nr:hypothetical protein [Candidatus Eisenbacteria bacterium]